MDCVLRLILVPLVLIAAPARAAGVLRVAVLPPPGDKAAARFADGVELTLDGNESVAVVPRDDVRPHLGSGADAFAAGCLKAALANARVDVLVRVSREGGTGGPLAVTVYDRDGLDVDRFEVGPVAAPAEAKPKAKSAGKMLAALLARWEDHRAARRERADDEDAIATRAPAGAERDWDADVVAPGDDALPPPPEPDARAQTSRGRPIAEPAADEAPSRPEPARRTPRAAPVDEPAPRRAARPTPPADDEVAPRRARRAADPDEDPPPRRASRAADPDEDPPPRRASRAADPDEDPPPRRAAPPRPPARAGPVDEFEDAMDEEIAPRPRRRPPPRPRPNTALLDDGSPAPQPGSDEWFAPGWVERWAKGLYSLDQPTPYFVVSAGPQGLVWSYALADSTVVKRKTSVCAPDPKALQATLLGCTPHGGGDVWVEAWPVRYLGVDASLRGDGTVYRPPHDSSGRPLTTPSYVPAAVVEGHLAAKARMVLTFGPVPGAALGVRLRLGYARSSVWEQKPFVGVPGYHAAQLGAGFEAHLPLLWKHLSFDARAEAIPLVIYQETAGFPTTASEAVLPVATLNNPGSSSVTLGYRVDAGVRGVILYGFFVELRGFSEGFGAYFTGVGKRRDRFERPIPDGRVANVSTGLTLAAGWLFPQ